MLCSLSISNYALIRELNIALPKGLSIITGETGAGKSILLGALSLVLGQRADTEVSIDKQANTVVEACFLLPPGESDFWKTFFEENQLDYDNELIVRRVITPAGKSRAFVNDQPVSLALLKDMGMRLIDIHSQHEHLLLAGSTYPMKVLDAYAKTASLLDEYGAVYNTASLLAQQVNDLRTLVDKQAMEEEYIQFQYTQLAEAALLPAEQESLEEEQTLLANATEVQQDLYQISQLLNGQDISILTQLKEAQKLALSVSSKATAFESLTERLEAVRLDCKDMASECDKAVEKVQANPKRLEEVEQRLQLLYDLERKHQVKTDAELIALRDSLKSQLGGAQDHRIQLLNLQKEWETAKALLKQTADKLHVKRESIAPDLSRKLREMLSPLGMPYAQVEFRLNKTEECGPSGNTQVEMWFSANKDIPMRELGKVASGGELSRLMLCVKSLVAAHVGLHTIIFDEVDAGVSGKIADCMGNMICNLSQQIQVLAITHLPQVAAKGEAHFLVTKQTETDSTITKVQVLSPQGRIIEVARMLSGEHITQAAIDNAKELLKYN